MIKAVAFDLDGVLIDSETLGIQTAVQSFLQAGVELSEAEKDYIHGRHPVDYIPTLGQKHGISLAMQKKIDELRHENYHALWDKAVSLMSDAKNIINYLKSRKITIVLATSSSVRVVNKFLNKFHFSNTFSLIVTKDDVTKRKPDPQIYNLVKKKINLKEKEILVVEDTQIGVESAKAAGLICLAIPNEYTKSQDFSKADYILRSLKELRKLL